MKSLKLILSAIAVTWLCNSCANAYIHNTFKTPIYDTARTKDLSFDAGTHHVGAGLSVAYPTNLQLLTAGHLSAYKGKLGGYGELGVGYHSKLADKTYVGAYYTIGMGSNNGAWDGAFLLGDDINIKCTYLKNSLNAYIKYKGKHFRPYLGLRASFVNFESYKVNEHELPAFEQITYEPVIGFDILPRNRFYFFWQNMIMIYKPSKSSLYSNFYLYDAPHYKPLTMRFGVGWTLK